MRCSRDWWSWSFRVAVKSSAADCPLPSRLSQVSIIKMLSACRREANQDGSLYGELAWVREWNNDGDGRQHWRFGGDVDLR